MKKIILSLLLLTILSGAFSRKVRIPSSIFQILSDCQCPFSCFRKLTTCVNTGMCKSCRRPKFGKRQGTNLASTFSAVNKNEDPITLIGILVNGKDTSLTDDQSRVEE